MINSTSNYEGLLGRDLLQKFKAEVVIYNLTEAQNTIRNIQVHLPIKANAKPVFHKARSIPFAFRQQVREEIDRLVKAEIF